MATGAGRRTAAAASAATAAGASHGGRGAGSATGRKHTGLAVIPSGEYVLGRDRPAPSERPVAPPRTGYIMFQHKRRPEIHAAGASVEQREIVSKIAAEWSRDKEIKRRYERDHARARIDYWWALALWNKAHPEEVASLQARRARAARPRKRAAPVLPGRGSPRKRGRPLASGVHARAAAGAAGVASARARTDMRMEPGIVVAASDSADSSSSSESDGDSAFDSDSASCSSSSDGSPVLHSVRRVRGQHDSKAGK